MEKFHESSRGPFYFVLKGKTLFHISSYAARKESIRDTHCYYVDPEKLKGKLLVMFTMPGGLHIFTIDNPEKKRMSPIETINELELVYLDTIDQQVLIEWNRYYKPMLSYLRKEITEREGFIPAILAGIHVVHDLKYPISFLIPYSNARRHSYLELTEQIHEIWVAVRIIREFTLEKIELEVLQSSQKPLAIFGDYALWLEFDFTPQKMCGGVIWRSQISPSPRLLEVYKRLEKCMPGRAGIRPDIIITNAKTCEEIIENPSIKLLIECKNTSYELWREDIAKQILPYKQILQPEHVLVVSMKPVPDSEKKQLKLRGIDVIDNVYLGGSGELELAEYVKFSLK